METCIFTARYSCILNFLRVSIIIMLNIAVKHEYILVCSKYKREVAWNEPEGRK